MDTDLPLNALAATEVTRSLLKALDMQDELRVRYEAEFRDSPSLRDSLNAATRRREK